MKFLKYFPLALIMVALLTTLHFYPRLPPMMATHWGITGQADGYSSKTFGVYFLPILLIGMYGLFLVLPLTDPYKNNFKQFELYFDIFICIILSFLYYLYLLTLFWNLGYQFDFVRWLSPGFALLFYYTGVLTSKAKRNWFVGIRTPWTMSSDKVWDKTHQLGGKLFKLVAASCLAGLVFPQSAFYLLLFPVLAASIFLFLYSYLQYRHLSS